MDRQKRKAANMKTNTELPIVENGYIDIYPADIERVEYDYIQSLPDENSIYNVNCFIGLLAMLNRELIKPALLNNSEIKPGCKGYDIKAIDSIFFGIFIPLVAKYHITPTIGLFSFLIGIDTNTMNKWKYNSTIDIDNNANDIDINNGNNSNDNSNNNIENDNYRKFQFYQKWNSFIENWIVQNTVSHNSIGSMFVLKAVYGYSDTQTIKVENVSELPKLSEQQLNAIAENSENALELPD